MTEISMPTRTASEIRFSLAQSFLERTLEWEHQYQNRGEEGLKAIESFRLGWDQIENTYHWAVKYMPNSPAWRALYCQLTRALCPFWRRRNETEVIQRKWLLCALRTAIALQREDLKVVFLEDLADLFYDNNHFVKSIFYYEKALHLVRKQVGLEDEARLLTGQANAMRDAVQRNRNSDSLTLLDAAEIHYQQAIGIASEKSATAERAYSNFGILKVRNDQPDRAIDLFLKALAIARALGDFAAQRRNLGNLASAYQNIGKFTEAMEYASQGIDIANQTLEARGRSQAYAARGFIFRKQGFFDEALKDFDQAFKIADKAKLPLIAARQADNESEIYFVQGRIDEALGHSAFAYDVAFKKSVAREIGFHGYTHGWNLIAAKQYDEAIEVLTNVAAQDGGQATMQAMVARGVAYYLKGVHDRALQDAQKAILQARTALDKSRQYKAFQVVGLGEVVKVLCGVGDIEDALDAYEQACLINHERGSVERQLILLNYVDVQNNPRIDMIRALLSEHLSENR